MLVEKVKGEIESNQSKYGKGYDAYVNTDSIDGVDKIYQEYKVKNVKIISDQVSLIMVVMNLLYKILMEESSE